MIGDSVSLRAVDPFNETFPYGTSTHEEPPVLRR